MQLKKLRTAMVAEADEAYEVLDDDYYEEYDDDDSDKIEDTACKVH